MRPRALRAASNSSLTCCSCIAWRSMVTKRTDSLTSQPGGSAALIHPPPTTMLVVSSMCSDEAGSVRMTPLIWRLFRDEPDHAAMALGILGIVVKGLLYLLFTGIGLLLVAFFLGALWMRRRTARRRHAR